MPIDSSIFKGWHDSLIPSAETLRTLAGATEEEFLQIGGNLQDFYGRSCQLSELASSLVKTVSGAEAVELIERLRQLLADMDLYLASAMGQSNESCDVLESVLGYLEKITEPLEGFQKMTKALRMLGISTKIESARMGEAGLGFVTLAQDVEKLSHQVNEKSSNILANRQALSKTISDNLRIVRQREDGQNSKVQQMLKQISENLQQFVELNQRCGSFGELVSAISSDVSGNISEVVSSMQMHDMTRQQVEHIVEALEKLTKNMESASDDEVALKALVVETGDVCELQEAQLKFATSELCDAVRAIVDNLRYVAEKQAKMAAEVVVVTGNTDGSSSSFMNDMKNDMAVVTSILSQCADADKQMSEILSGVAATLQEVTGFVTNIEEIGSEIELIALNSQIKAALTGEDGAALGVLAEAVKRLSDDAGRQTKSVSELLVEINSATEHLFQEANSQTAALQEKVHTVDWELSVIMTNLGVINNEMSSVLANLTSQVYSLTSDIDTATSSIDVHIRVQEMSDKVVSPLAAIVDAARNIEPASSEFKNNLKFMEERYTMQSERHIHEAIAAKRSGAKQGIVVAKKVESASSVDSEFGDNVDLF